MGGLKNSGNELMNIAAEAQYADECKEKHFKKVIEARKMLSQIYFRQNMYVLAAQKYDQIDMLWYLVPNVVTTAVSSFLGFAATSAMVDKSNNLRAMLSLLCGVLAVVATMITAL